LSVDDDNNDDDNDDNDNNIIIVCDELFLTLMIILVLTINEEYLSKSHIIRFKYLSYSLRLKCKVVHSCQKSGN